MTLALKAAVSAFAGTLTLRMVPGLATVNIDSLVPCWQSHECHVVSVASEEPKSSGAGSVNMVDLITQAVGYS